VNLVAGSRCTLTNDAELAEAYNIALSMSKQILYIDLVVETKEAMSETISIYAELPNTNICPDLHVPETTRWRSFIRSACEFIQRIKTRTVETEISICRPYKSVALTNVNIEKSGLGTIKVNSDIESTLALDESNTTQTTDSLCGVV
jgi:hypothetical protein